jgi:hypothetical protein
LIINIDSAGLESLIGEKVSQLNPGLSAEEKAKLVAAAKMEHEMYFSLHSETSTRSNSSTTSTLRSISPKIGQNPTSSANYMYLPHHLESFQH